MTISGLITEKKDRDIAKATNIDGLSSKILMSDADILGKTLLK